MSLPQHLLRLQPAAASRNGETIGLARPTDVGWGLPIFRAPTLPTPQQISNELPFTVNFRRRDTSRP